MRVAHTEDAQPVPFGDSSLGMGDNDSEYSGPCSCFLNCVRSWRERDRLRRHTEFLRQGDLPTACLCSALVILCSTYHTRFITYILLPGYPLLFYPAVRVKVSEKGNAGDGL